MKNNDPVHLNEDDQKWYFWNEVWADRFGPYDTEEIAREKVREYCEKYL